MPEESGFTEVTASLLPKKDIAFADFDFDLHMEMDYLGAQSDQLVYEGKGKFQGSDFTFSGPVKMIKLQYSLGKKWNAEMKYEANYFDLKEWLFDVAASDLVVEGASLSDDDKAALLKSLTEKVGEVKDQCVAGKEDIIPNFPMDTVVPFIGMFYAAQFSEKI